MMRHSALVDFALFFCPREFREGYRRTMREDVVARRNQPAEAFDIVKTGLALHVENLWREIAYSARALWATPLYSVVSIGTIGLAIGANVAVAGVLEGVIFRPLPYSDPGRLAFVSDGFGGRISFSNAFNVAQANRTFARIAIRHGESESTAQNGTLVMLAGSAVTSGYFELLGAVPELGRVLNSHDSGNRRVVISDRFWRSAFERNPRVLGSRLRLGTSSYQIVGVLPDTFTDPTITGLERRDYWSAPDPNAGYVQSRDNHTFEAIARLRSGVTLAAASADVRRILRLPLAGATPIANVIVGPVRPLLWLAYAAVLALLIIACGNVANLGLVRSTGREREYRIRSALGASARRIAMQFSIEAGLIAIAGGALGFAISLGTLRAFGTIGSQFLPRWTEVRVDTGVAVYGVALVLLTMALTGFLPILHARSGGALKTLKLRETLVVVEIALALTVTISAGLLVRSFETLRRVDLGFDASGTYFVSFSGPDRLNDAQMLAVVTRLQREIASIPGVVETALAGPVPYTYEHDSKLTIPGRAPIPDRVADDEVSPGFFRLVNIPIAAGRDFSDRDTSSSQPVAIVDTAFAVKYFGTAGVIGRLIEPWRASEPDVGPASPIAPRRIIGVVGNTRRSLSGAVAPTVYLPIAQVVIANHVLIRTTPGLQNISKSINAAFARADRRIPQPSVLSFDEILSDDVAAATAAFQLLSGLAFVALLLALAGVYAVTSESVSGRYHEFGIRKAVGARDGDILRSVFRRTSFACVTGVALGLLLAAGCSNLLASLLFETSALDPTAFLACTSAVAACTLLAALLPAFRATFIDAAAVLRYE